MRIPLVVRNLDTSACNHFPQTSLGKCTVVVVRVDIEKHVATRHVSETLGDEYFWPTYSDVSTLYPLTVGTPVYAQVDTYNGATDYGAIQEGHEVIGGYYNNVFGRSTVKESPPDETPITDWGTDPGLGDLPPRE